MEALCIPTPTFAIPDLSELHFQPFPQWTSIAEPARRLQLSLHGLHKADEGLASFYAYVSVALFISFLLNTGALGGRPI
jgi:hypothetical protein